VTGELRFRRAHLTVLVGALALGLLTAVLISRADAGATRYITIVGGPEELITIKGSDRRDSLTIDGSAPGGITIYANRDFTSTRTDCTLGGTTPEIAYCLDEDVETIDVGLVEGRDELRFGKTFQATNVDITGRGGTGGDELRGSAKRDDLQGNGQDDELRGRSGPDDLDGGSGDDLCVGGPGGDDVENCER
jgi:Ca2+-binding RTX toxin-like protein